MPKCAPLLGVSIGWATPWLSLVAADVTV